MKKINSTVIFGILLLVLITPSITFAAWWNPLSWFNFSKNKPVQTEIIQKQTGNPTKTTRASTTTPATMTEASSTDQSVRIEKLEKEISELKKATKPVPVKNTAPVIIPKTEPIITTTPPTVSTPTNPTPEQMAKIIASCNLNEAARKSCASNNIIQLYISDIKFRDLMDLTIELANKKRQEAENKTNVPIYVPAYIPKEELYTPTHVPTYTPSSLTPTYPKPSISDVTDFIEQQKQERFNRETCSFMGGSYIGGDCVRFPTHFTDY